MAGLDQPWLPALPLLPPVKTQVWPLHAGHIFGSTMCLPAEASAAARSGCVMPFPCRSMRCEQPARVLLAPAFSALLVPGLCALQEALAAFLLQQTALQAFARP